MSALVDWPSAPLWLVIAMSLVLHAVPAEQPLARALPCNKAALVDGLLRCDGELDVVPTDCTADVWQRVRPGDDVDTSLLCGGVHTMLRMAPDDLAALEQPVDVNRASEDELASLPGVGPALARAMVLHRPFRSVDELDRVPGIGTKRLTRLRARARVFHDE